MKYNLIEIRRNVRGGWYALHSQDEMDRENVKTSPNSLGFFYYPRKGNSQTAFLELKQKMIADRQTIVHSLEQEIQAIQSLVAPF